MAVSDSYRAFVVEQLSKAAPAVHARRMFGGYGIYQSQLIFAIISGDVLYMKTDDQTRAAYEARGSMAFDPHGDGRVSMQYYQLPEDILEDRELLREWTEAAIGAARRTKASKGKSARKGSKRRPK